MDRNKLMMQDFEWYLKPDKKHWKRVAKEAKKLKENGVTAVWLPPAYKGANGVHDVGYAVYDLYDLGEFNQKGTVETKYGSKDEYLMAIKTLQDAGIEVLADIVLGHRMGADEKERIFAYGHDEYDRNREIQGKKKITVWTKFTFPGRNGKYSDFKWDWTNFHGTDYDAKSKQNGIYRFIGKEWDSDVDGEFGNYDYLMGVDLDMSDEEVVEELQRWGEWYFEFTKVDGFRLDAVKHIDFNFFRNWLGGLRDKYQKPIFAVGEYWNAELHILENYIEKTQGALTLFDVPLHFNMFHASISNGYFDMRYILKNTLLHSKPELSVTFVDNHDTEPGQALQSYILEWFKLHAYCLILLREEGYPCVFYGDYYGVSHCKLKPIEGLKELMNLRKDASYGVQHDYFNHPKIVGWTREGINEIPDSGFAVIMTVEKGGMKRMYVGKHFAGCIFEDILHHVEDTIEIDENGFGEFLVEDGSVSVWKAKKGEKIGERLYFIEKAKLQNEKEENQNNEESVLDDALEQEELQVSEENEMFEEHIVSEQNTLLGENIAEENILEEDALTAEEETIPEPDEFGRYVDGVYRDWIEVSAYEGPQDCIEEDLFYDSKYTHLNKEPEPEPEEEEQAEALEETEVLEENF